MNRKKIVPEDMITQNMKMETFLVKKILVLEELPKLIVGGDGYFGTAATACVIVMNILILQIVISI